MYKRLQTNIGGIIVVVALGLSGCGVGPDGSPEEESAPSTIVADQPVSQVVEASDLTVPDSLPTDSVPVEPSDPSPAEGSGQDSIGQASIDQRLEDLIASQDALTQRLDSFLAAASPSSVASAVTPAVTPGQAAGAAPGEVLDEARDKVQSFGVAIFWSLLVLVVFNFLIRALLWVLGALSERSAKRRLFYKRLVPIVRIVLWAFAAYLIVRVIFRVDAQGFLAASAAVGVAVGFASQDLLKNLFGGLILVFDQPFQVGDKITVGGTYGEVVSIGLRSTRIVTADDNLVTVPNANMVDQQVANANAGELNCQVVTDFYLPGWVDESKASGIAFEAAASSKYVYLKKPIVTLVKDEFKETFLTRIRVKAYVLDPRFEFLFQSDVTERARAGFREAGLLRPEHGMRAWVDLSQAGASADSLQEDTHGED